MSRILVVDDEPDILLALQVVLEIAGYDVIAAVSGAEALQKARELPDAIVLDVRLPDISGIEVLRRLKADETLSALPVLCLSAHSSPETRQKALDLGASGYMNKPFIPDELRAAIEELIASSGPVEASA